MASVIKLCCRFLRDKFRAGLHFGCLRVPVEEHCLPCSYSPLCFTSLWDRLGGRGMGGRMGHPHWCSWLPRWGGGFPVTPASFQQQGPPLSAAGLWCSCLPAAHAGGGRGAPASSSEAGSEITYFFFFLFLMLFGGCCFLLPNIS